MKREWLFDLLVGGIAGGLVGGIVAVNLVIFSGIEPGYQATIPEVFSQNTLIGVVTIAVLIAGPVLGVYVARRIRRRRRTLD